jgi:predicted component of type VI protein secretion system
VKKLSEIQNQLRAGEFEFTRHAFKRVVERNISELEIIQMGENVVIIEDYPDDKYSPSCLLLGLTSLGRALHLQVSRMDSNILKIITIYEPNNDEWIDYRTRR